MTKILFVADARSPIAQNWIRHFVQRGDEVYLAATFQGDIGFPLAGFEFTPVAFSAIKQNQRPNKRGFSLAVGLRTRIRQWIGPLTLSRSAQKLRAYINQVQPDIIHALRIPYEGMLAASAGFDTCTAPSAVRCKCTPRKERGATQPAAFITSVWGNDFTLHAPSTPLMGYHTRKTMQAITALHADCERDIRLAAKWGFDSAKPTLVTPGNGGIHTDVFYPPVESVREPVIINPRGFRAYIRNDMFFKAIPLVLQKYPQAKFIFSSMQGEAQAIQWIKELNIEHAVTLNPPVAHTQMAEIFRAAQIVASPSIHDGTPNTLLEGMACGCFPIAGDLESIREWITHGENGLLFDANDPQSIAEAILMALKNEDLRHVAAGLNTKVISERAEYEGNMERVEEFYKTVIGDW
jgi:glycosyltransferase involved in cell wall biosynthesis